ncbi:MAG: uroporphyrinogen-III C-methyltransferase [Candidatus Kapabacteria bacterium]|jgi:uroporphyrinogen III methyltransferase/synthase|nr:uroporphyrinogen-III C-methyltransferase [Candidatus Kapabacteria bacterium]
MSDYGTVYIVGAGPGDPGLITVKGMEILEKVDVVLYDKLANPELLMKCAVDAEMIFVGKAAGHHYVAQEDTIQMLIDKAKSGKNVARLKGGDPYIFGRGSEEALALIEEGIRYEIVPGITAAVGATAYAGIPLTHRNMVTQCMFITAHEKPGKEESQVDWQQLAQLKNTTLVIYMGVSMIPMIVPIMIEFGADPNTPAALIENGTLPFQREVVTSLAEIPEALMTGNFKPPLIFVISPNALLSESLKPNYNKALSGKRVVATRAKDQAYSLYDALSNEGAEVVPFRVIRTELSTPGKSMFDIFSDNDYDWMLFSSENGVRYFFELLRLQNGDARIIGKTKIAVIGSGTERSLKKFGLRADFVPSKYTSASLLEELAISYGFSATKVLRIKGDFKKDMLTDGMRDMGINTDTLEVYKLLRDKPEDNIIEELKSSGADAYMFTSVSTVNNFFEILGDREARRMLTESLTIAIGPVTGAALREKEVQDVVESPVHTIDGMIKILKGSV